MYDDQVRKIGLLHFNFEIEDISASTKMTKEDALAFKKRTKRGDSNNMFDLVILNFYMIRTSTILHDFTSKVLFFSGC